MSGSKYLLRLLWSVLFGVVAANPVLAASASQQPTFTSASLAGLVDASGKTVRDEDFAGKYRIVLFGFSSCADVCPLTLLSMKEALARMRSRAKHVVPVFISVDPERDSGNTLGKYVHAFDARIRALTGSAQALQRVATGHGVFFEKRWIDVSKNAYVFDHTASVLVIDPDGKLVASVSTAAPPREVAGRIAAAIP